MNTITESVGRRKKAIAQIKFLQGSGEFIINGKAAFLYMQENPSLLSSIQGPLEFLSEQKNFSIIISVKGGGLSGQADAIKLGLARGICLLEDNSRKNLKIKGFLRRDSRVKERKKYGLRKARKASQYSKR